MKYSVEILEERRGYFLRILRSGKLPLVIDKGIIKYFNLTPDMWYSNLLKFNGKLIDNGIFFKNYIDCDNAKEWLEDNLDYFLILKKLGGNK